MGEKAPNLEELIGAELSGPVPEAVRRVADEIRRRYGDALASVVFYGSCLRRGTSEGVLDFYALVDSYREVYRSRAPAWANALLPPNVFYLEIDSPGETLRSKYAVMTSRDFETAAGARGLRSSVWARFCQPALLVYARDEAARQSVARAVLASVVSALQRGLPLLPAQGDVQRVRLDEFWQNTLRETYSAELRTETPETIRSVYLAAPERFDRVARGGLELLAGRGWLEWQSEGDLVSVRIPAGRRRRAARAWRLRRPLMKAVSLIALIKSALTFGDWLPYALWKLERHTGTRIELTERQRRHPFVWGWPVFFRALRQRDLR